MSAFAGVVTYAIGQAFAEHFEGGRSLLDVDVSRMKRMFKREYKKGTQVARNTEVGSLAT